MRFLKKGIDYKRKTGFIYVMITEKEDIWHIYNLIKEGDEVRAACERKI